MNPDTWTILAVGVALGGLVWQMLRSLRMNMVRLFEDIDKKFDDMGKKFEDNFRDVRNRLDRLAAGHHGLARELSELPGVSCAGGSTNAPAPPPVDPRRRRPAPPRSRSTRR